MRQGNLPPLPEQVMAPTSTSASTSIATGYDSPSSSYFILNNLPRGAEFGLDTQLWTVDKFSVSSTSISLLCQASYPTFPTQFAPTLGPACCVTPLLR